MSLHHYKLKFFPVKSRGEYIRILFAFAEVPFENELITSDRWPTIKDTTPFGSLPVLEIDGKEVIAQHVSVGRYLAKSFGIAGSDMLHQAKADMLVDGTAEFWAHWVPIYTMIKAGNKEKTAENGTKFYQETFKPWADRYTKFLNQNGTGWFVGNSLTWADIYIAEWCDRIQLCIGHYVPVLADYPDLKAHMERVLSIPSIAKYYKSRPDTPF